MWDLSADYKHNTVLLLFEDAIGPLGPAGGKDIFERRCGANIYYSAIYTQP